MSSAPITLPPPQEPRYGIKDPLGPSDEVHRCLRLYALEINNRELGHMDALTAGLEPLGYTRQDLEKCIKDYGNFWNMYEKDGKVAFSCMPSTQGPIM